MSPTPFTPCPNCRTAFEGWHKDREAEYERGLQKKIAESKSKYPDEEVEDGIALLRFVEDPRYAHVKQAMNSAYKQGAFRAPDESPEEKIPAGIAKRLQSQPSSTARSGASDAKYMPIHLKLIRNMTKSQPSM